MSPELIAAHALVAVLKIAGAFILGAVFKDLVSNLPNDPGEVSGFDVFLVFVGVVLIITDAVLLFMGIADLMVLP